MSNLEKIEVVNVKEISLEYLLKNAKNKYWIPGKIAKSRYSLDLGAAINKDIRDVDHLIISNELQNFLNKYIEPHVYQYAKKHNMSISQQNAGYSFNRYSAGQFFKEHVDSTSEEPRTISIVLYLNDDYEGGTITFTKLNKSFKPEANSLFIFPSNEEFMHSADPVISGVKYIVVGFWS